MPVKVAEIEGSPWLTVRDAAKHAKVGAKTVYREIRSGRLKAAVIGGRRDLRLRVEWIDAWMESKTTVTEMRRGR